MASPSMAFADADETKKLRRGKGRWASGIFDCCSDCCTSCAVIWCPCVTLAQLWQKLLGPKGACRLIFVFLLLLMLSQFALGSAFSYVYWKYVASGWTRMAGKGASGVSGWSITGWSVAHGDPTLWGQMVGLRIAGLSVIIVSCLLVTVLTAMVRLRVRVVDSIPGECCGGAEDCCCSLWCNTCTQCMLLRHLGYTNGQYRLCSETGERSMSDTPADFNSV